MCDHRARILAVLGLSVGLVSALSAADVSTAATVYTKAPPVAPSSWTGFYMGVNVGGTWADPSVNVTTLNPFNNIPVLSSQGRTAGPAAAVAATGSVPASNSGVIGGGQLGYNYQFWQYWVAGFETDIEGVGHHSGSSVLTQVAPRIGFPLDTMTATIAATQQINYLGTVRARLGALPPPNLLTYVTGGFAYGGAESSATVSGGDTPNTGSTNFAGAASASTTRGGDTVGAGVEWLFAPGWSAKAEYLYYDLGTVSYSNGAMNSFLNGTTTITFTDASASSVRLNEISYGRV
jgi:outer membrane immunogenic protein